jgi:hypothetical protein
MLLNHFLVCVYYACALPNGRQERPRVRVLASARRPASPPLRACDRDCFCCGARVNYGHLKLSKAGKLFSCTSLAIRFDGHAFGNLLSL